MVGSLIVLILIVIVVAAELPPLIKKGWWKEALVYFILLLVGGAVSLAPNNLVQIPSPLNLLPMIYKPIMDWLNHILV